MHWQLKLLSESLINANDVIKKTNDGVFKTSLKGRYIDINDRLAFIYGFDSKQEMMAYFKDIGSELYVEEGRRSEFQKLMSLNGRVDDFESQVRRKDGSFIWIRETAWFDRDSKGDVVSYSGIITDITAQRRYYYDELTKLPKRFLLEEKLQKMLNENATSLGLILLEVQEYIDTKNIEGESTMDQMILEMSRHLIKHAYSNMYLARIEQNQFICLYAEANQINMLSFVSKIQKLKNMNFKFENSHFNYNEFCLGLLLNPDPKNLTAPQALSQVQLACRHAKEAKHVHAIFESQMEVLYRKQVDLVSQLRQAIEKKEFYLVFHPQFNLIDQKMMGVETLIRWRKPDGEEVPPDVFIPIAEAKGLIHQIGFWVMEEAFKVLRRWQKRGSQRKMSVNVSVAQFIQEDFVEKVLDILDKTKVNPKQIILEITESGEIPDSKIEKLNQTIEVFRELGIEASHDDFGAGNSIDHLLRLSLDELKMDKSFWDSPNAKKLLKMVATLAQDLGVRLVVEGVETNEQLDSLKELGIDLMVQGYLFSKPLRLEVLEKSFGSS